MTDVLSRDEHGHVHLDANHLLQCDACLQALEIVLHALENLESVAKRGRRR